MADTGTSPSEIGLSNEGRRDRAVREIYDTEKSYVASLEILVKVPSPPIISTQTGRLSLATPHGFMLLSTI